MDLMTPEERFTKMENVLAAVIESQAKHEAAIRDLIAVSRTTLNAVSELRESQKEFRESQMELRESQKELSESQRESQKEWLESQREWREGQKELREAQKLTEEKLHILIETVDRIIREKK